MQVKSDERAKVTGENFNVFSILDRERKEVTTHSAIIAELLNPHGSHSQGTLFLKLLLKQLEPTIDVSNEHTFKVRTEEFVFDPKKGEKGYLDIVIESGDAYIVIENKIDTVDAEGQLEKYCKHIEEIKKDTKVLLYLTPEGKEPETKKLTLCGKGPVYKLKEFPFPLMCLSYKDFIDEWLDACIKEVARIPQIREALHQYQMTVKKLTRQLPSEVKDILKSNGAEELKDKIIKHMQCEFWRELKERLVKEQLSDQNSKFQLYESDIEVTEISDEELEENISHPSLGLTFTFQMESIGDKKHEVVFRVYYEKSTIHSYFNYGFVCCTEDTLRRVNIERHKEALNRYTRLKHTSDGQDGWLSWEYFWHDPESFITESKETLIRKLISEIDLALSKAKKGNKA